MAGPHIAGTDTVSLHAAMLNIGGMLILCEQITVFSERFLYQTIRWLVWGPIELRCSLIFSCKPMAVSPIAIDAYPCKNTVKAAW
jgi:hypothetical protein